MRRQLYEWRNVVPTGTIVSNTGHPVLVEGSITTVALRANKPYDIFVGDVGNNLEKPGELLATQFIVIDSIGCWPTQSAVNVRINTTRYFQDPTGVPMEGLTGSAVPFPDSNTAGLFTFESFVDGLTPTIYVLPGQTWGVEYMPLLNVAAVADPTADSEIARAVVRYLLIDGVDQLIAVNLLKNSIPVSAENIQWYKQNLIRHKLMSSLSDEIINRELLAKHERRYI